MITRKTRHVNRHQQTRRGARAGGWNARTLRTDARPPCSMASSRRTRSQLALPAFDLNQLARSPLKDARQALRNNQSPQTNPGIADVDPRLFSPLHKQPKRPSSPFKDHGTYERDSKRARHDDQREENQSPLLGPRRPPSASSIRESTVPLDTPSKFRRAQSVPIWPSAPLIDLNHIPRSPSKPSPVLRIATLPIEGVQPVQPVAPLTTQEPIAQLTLNNASSPAPIPPSTPEQTMAPTSPLTPLTPLSEVTDLPRFPSEPAQSSSDDTPTAAPSIESSSFHPAKSYSAHPAESSSVYPVETPKRAPSAATIATPSTGFSRLPRPSFVASSRPPSVKKPEYSKAPSKRQEKPRTRLGPIPLGGRMTRSAALRQKESAKKEGIAEATTPKPVAGSSTPALRFTPARPAPDAADQSNKPAPLHKRRSFSFSFAQPTTSSAAKSTPRSPERDKRHSGLPIPSTSGSSSNASTSSKPLSAAAVEQTPLNSSLSSLSLALKKLCMPVPSRPGTSLGVHLGPTGTSDESPTEVSMVQSTPSRPPASIAAIPARVVSLQRAATVGDFFKAPTQTQTKPKQMALTFTPAPSSRPPEAKKRITVHSGIVAGKPKGKISFGRFTPAALTAGPSNSRASSSAVPAAPQSNARPGAHGGSRVFPRASKKSSLPMVEGSPVKGGADDANANEEAVNAEGASIIEQAIKQQRGADGARPSTAVEEDATVPPSVPATEELTVNASTTLAVKRDPSRRASLALQLFRESQLIQSSKLPETPIASSSSSTAQVQKGPSTDSSTLVKRHTPATGTFRKPPPSSSFHFNLRERPEPKSAPTVLKRSASAAHVSAKGKRTEPPEGEGTPGRMRGVLRECTVFVDVRTDDGDDAGALFVDMLADMGAKVCCVGMCSCGIVLMLHFAFKVLTRVGQTCTHVIFKNGLLSTLTRYRLLKEPRPLAVGIAWVVECAEQCKRVDEARFLISLDGVNVAGTQKRRRSMLPRQFHTLQSADTSAQSATSPDATSLNLASRVFSLTMTTPDAQRSSSPSVADTDEANRSGSGHTLLPLEMARRRRSVLPGP
ncbi:hypothetical protein DAEQUDRAFT_250685 [Daedalea quercina L-15889]|uniref:BRCT domain-containing protein n=1 Tax=Daedalea quercina L-15889 TaxID=1314783 RepID=A0A165QNJ6_9APHY|nr:hypothetical protein DAEQUDRAFT_250685 [Daedalea quercina L-15889]